MDVPNDVPNRSAGQAARLQRLKMERERRRHHHDGPSTAVEGPREADVVPDAHSTHSLEHVSGHTDSSHDLSKLPNQTKGSQQQILSAAVIMETLPKASAVASVTSTATAPGTTTVESPIPQTIQRALGDRSYEKRKTAAVEIEVMIKALAEPILTSVMTSATATFTVTPQNSSCMPMIQSIIQVLSKDFCSSMNSNFRKGGLIGLAATAIGLMVPPSFQTQLAANTPYNSQVMGNPSYNSALSKQVTVTGISPVDGNKESPSFKALVPNNFLVAYFLDSLLKPVLQCFDDPESRVRYYACESLYNISKVARGAIFQSNIHTPMQGGTTSPTSALASQKRHFALIFDGLTKLCADVDTDVKNGANLLDRLIKDIVTECCEVSSAVKGVAGSALFQVEQDFLPLLQTYIRRTNPSIRQLLVGWIAALNTIPDISIIDYLPEFLDGLFNMLSDTSREIRQAADSILGEFLREIRTSSVVQLGPILGILTQHCSPNKDRLNRLTAVSWLAEIIDHPMTGYESFVPFHADLLVAFLTGISDVEPEVRKISQNVCNHLMGIVADKVISVEDDAVLYGKQLSSLLSVLQKELVQTEDIPTKLATLEWINMLVEKRKEIYKFVSSLLPVLLKTLNDSSDDVVLLDLQVLSRIALLSSNFRISSMRRNLLALARKEGNRSDTTGGEVHDEANFILVINAILTLFASDRKLMENRGSLIVRKLCVLLNAQQVYIRIASALVQYETKGDQPDVLEFISTTVQILNLILLTAPELHSLRQMLRSSSSIPLEHGPDGKVATLQASPIFKSSLSTHKLSKKSDDYLDVFSALFRCWCHNNIASFSLCLIAQRYDLAFALVKRFSDMDVTVGFLMQVDKLVHLLESPIFIHLRLQLLDVESPNHIYLLKSCYGLLMLLPQSDAFRSLNDRLTAVCNLRDNLGIPPCDATFGQSNSGAPSMQQAAIPQSLSSLLDRFDAVTAIHDSVRNLKGKPENNSFANDTVTTSDGRNLLATSSMGFPSRGNTTIAEAKANDVKILST